jgi:hypothetical protein
MRYVLLLPILLGGMVFALAANQAETAPITGDWHLIGASEGAFPLPQHRMDLRFKQVDGGLAGAILSRRDGSEIPLANAELSGDTLRVRIQGGPATLVMTRRGDHFEGYWTGSALVQLKLVR